MKLGKKFKSGESTSGSEWVITYWKGDPWPSFRRGGDFASNEQYCETYELLDFEPPEKPLVPEVGKWYLVLLKNFEGKLFRQCVKASIGWGSIMVDLDGVERGVPHEYEFLEEWAKVEK